MSPLPQTHLEVEQGDTLEIAVGPVTVPNPVTLTASPIDLTAANLKLWFTAKAAKTDADADAKLRLGNTATGLTGIEADVPATAAKNWATVTATPAQTAALAAGELFYDVQMLEPTGRKTTLRRGKLLVVADVTDA